MLQPDTKTVTEAGQLVAAATAKQQSGDLRASLDKFAMASSLLKSELHRLDMQAHTQQLPVDPSQKQFLQSYVAQLEAQRAALEQAAGQQDEERLQREAAGARQRRQEQEQEHERLKQEQHRPVAMPAHEPAPAKSNPAASSTSSPTGGSKGPSTIAPPPPSTMNTSDLDHLVAAGRSAAPIVSSNKYAGTKLIAGGALRTSNFAARASDIVYRAIEHATKLAAAGQFKAAADVVQHAYTVGTREDHRPSNLEKLPLLARELRLKFLARCPPRPPQDNARTDDERDVLRASGRTERLLLFEWDSVEDGYPYENIWMPGRSNAPFEDEAFVPRMAPEQLKAKPRFIRFPDMVALYDDFMGVVSQEEADKKKKEEEEGKSEEEQLAAALEAELKPEGEDKAPEASVDDGAAVAAAAAAAVEPTRLCVVQSAPDPMTIRQTVVSDCSLVCSLIVTANYERRFPGSRLIRSAIFPQNEQGEPIVNPKGKYCVKMLLNGTTRVVAVDDRFPVAHVPEHNGSQLQRLSQPPMALCSHTTNKGEMWVSLMEKAFIKVCGGSYDFPGSNSSNDLYRLSGWLPDILRFPNTGQRYGAAADTMAGSGDAVSNDDRPFDADLQWRRLSSCHARGALVLTIATPAELPKVVEEKLKLIPGHAYAVLDFKQTSPAQGNYRLVKVKNPWSTQPWQGLFGIEDARRCTPEMLAELNHSKDEAETGVFWMTWQDVVKFFAVAHLSWNPFSLFPPPPQQQQQQRYLRPTRLSRHAHDKSSTSGYCESHQFQVLIPPSQVCHAARRMHLVLSRHVLDDSEYEENELVNQNQQQQQQQSGKKAASAPFIACHVYDTTHLPSLSAQCKSSDASSSTPLWQTRFAGNSSSGGGRRLKSRAETELCKCLHRGVYSNSAASTFSFDCPAGPRELCVIVSRLPRDARKNQQQQQQQQLSHDDCAPFPFSVTLYTNLPYTATATTTTTAISTSAVHFSAMPPLKAQLRNRTVLPAEWKSGQSCGGPVGQQTFTYNPQFTFTLSQEAHLQAEILSPVECPINLVVCRLKDSEADITNEGDCPWAIRVDNVSSANHPLALYGPFSCRYGSAVDSSLADCIAIGDKARAPPVQESSSSSSPAAPAAPVAALSLAQLLPTLTLEVRVPAGGGGGPAPTQQAFIGALSDHPSLMHAVHTAPLSTWLIPLLLSRNYVASDIFSKAVCFGQQMDWSAPLKPAVLQHAVEQQQRKELVFVVVLLTEELPRTTELSSIEKNLASAATTALQVIAMINSNSGDRDAFNSSAAAINDAVERQVLALDSCASVRTEDVKKTRSVLVRAFQAVHSLVDFITKSPPPPPPAAVPQPPTSSSPPALAAAAAYGDFADDNKKNPLRTIQTVPAGRYVIVAAMQEKGVPGPFSIAVECEEEPVELRALPAEGAGWRALPNVTAAWAGSSAAGPPAPHGSDDGWAAYRKNPTVQLTVPPAAASANSKDSNNKILLFCRLLSLPPAGSNISATEVEVAGQPAMQLMLFKGAVGADSVVATSGRFSNNGVTLKRSLSATNKAEGAAGSVLHGVPLEPGAAYFVVMSTFDGKKDSGWRCALKMFVHGDERGGGITSKLLFL